MDTYLQSVDYKTRPFVSFSISACTQSWWRTENTLADEKKVSIKIPQTREREWKDSASSPVMSVRPTSISTRQTHTHTSPPLKSLLTSSMNREGEEEKYFFKKWSPFFFFSIGQKIFIYLRMLLSFAGLSSRTHAHTILSVLVSRVRWRRHASTAVTSSKTARRAFTPGETKSFRRGTAETKHTLQTRNEKQNKKERGIEFWLHYY